MRMLRDMLWIELRKVTRSKVPLFTALGFLVMPLIGALLIFIYKDPELARKLGIMGSKANLVVGSADWAGYLTLMVQFTSLGGFFFFFLSVSWVFGREFSDGTIKDILAVPVPRYTIVLAKFIVSILWSLALIVETSIAGILLGMLIKLPGGTGDVILHGLALMALTSVLSITLVLPFAFFASIGRGFLLPVGVGVLTMIFSNLAVTLGWGEYFPWAVPALLLQGETTGFISYFLVALTGTAGIAVTILWWYFADQNR